MDPGNSQVDVVRDVRDIKTLANKNCKECWGRGTKSIVVPNLATPVGNLPQLCNCVVHFLKKNPDLAFEFLKLNGQAH